MDRISKTGKENTQKPNTSDPDYRQNLFNTLQKSGIMDGIKSQLRVQLLNKLQGKLTGPSIGSASEEQKIEEDNKKLKRRIICSLISDYLQKAGYMYTESVFVPETGFSSNMLSVPEMEQLLKITGREGDSVGIPLLEYIAGNLLEESLEGYKKKANEYAQTEESTEGLTLDQRLKQIDMEYSSAKISERIMPFKELEERMLKYKREVDAKFKTDLASEIARMREIEMSAVRLEEASKYRVKMQEYRNELEQLHQDKLQKLKQREAEVTERCKIKERELENASFEHRQRVLKDMELISIKEQEIKKGLEVRLKEVELEKTNILRMKEDYETKLKEIDRLKAKCDEKIHEEIESFKIRYDREHETLNKNLIDKRRDLENMEYLVHVREEKCKEAEENIKRTKADFIELQDKYKEIQKKLDDTERKLRETIEHLTIVSTTAKRDQELLGAKETENKLLKEELSILKKAYEDEKTHSSEHKNEYAQTISELKTQLENSKQDLISLREQYKQAEKERTEVTQYKFEQEKTRLTKEIEEKDAKILELQRDYENEKAYNEHVANNYKAHTVAVLQRENMAHPEKVPESPLSTSFLHDPEYLSQKNRWMQLEQETEALKTNVRTALIPSDPLGYNQMPDRLSSAPLYTEKLRDHMLYSPALYKKMSESEANKEISKTLVKEPIVKNEEIPPKTQWIEEQEKKITQKPVEIDFGKAQNEENEENQKMQNENTAKFQEMPKEEPDTVIHKQPQEEKQEEIEENYEIEEVQEISDVPKTEEKSQEKPMQKAVSPKHEEKNVNEPQIKPTKSKEKDEILDVFFYCLLNCKLVIK